MTVRVTTDRHDNVRTTAGTEEYVDDRHGMSPQAVLFAMGNATADGTINAQARLGVGMSDGPTARSVAITSQNGVSPNTKRWASATKVFTIGQASGANIVGEFEWNAWVDNDGTPKYGTEVDWTDPVTAALDLMYMHFGGEDCEYEVVEFTSDGTIGNTVDVGSLGGKPDFAIVVGADEAFDRGGANDSHISIGFLNRDGEDAITQCVFCHGEADAEVTASVGAAARKPSATDKRCGLTFSWAGGTPSLGGGIEATSILSDGIEFTTQDANTATTWTVLMGRCKTARMETAVFHKLSPAATAPTTDTVTEPGFRPQAAIEVATMIHDVESIQTNANGECFSINMHGNDGASAHSENYAVDDGQSTSDTDCWESSEEQICRYGGASSSAGEDCDITSGYTSTGWGRTFSLTRPSATKMTLFLVFGDADVYPTCEGAPIELAGRGDLSADGACEGRATAELLGQGEPAADIEAAARGFVELLSRGDLEAIAALDGRAPLEMRGRGMPEGEAFASARGYVELIGRAAGSSTAAGVAYGSGRGALELFGRAAGSSTATLVAFGPCYGALELFGRGEASGEAGAPGRASLGLYGRGAAEGIAAAAGRAILEMLGRAPSTTTQDKFFVAVAKLCRTRWRTEVADALSLATRYENLPFTKPAGAFAEMGIDFDSVEPLGAADGGSSIMARGRLIMRVWSALHEGEAGPLAVVESVRGSFTNAVQGGRVRFQSPSETGRGREGGRWWIDVDCPFWVDDKSSRGAIVVPITSGDGGYDDAYTVIRERLKAQVETPQAVYVQYPNMPPAPPTEAKYIRAAFFSSESRQATYGDASHLIGGTMVLQVFTPLNEGDKGSLDLLDAIDEAFRTVIDRGVIFSPPVPSRGMRRGARWQRNVSVRWRSQAR
ncbi:MAG: hypothetical protein GY944_08600 [bacterium]|nr:hypothetical protein [bacterium]